MRALGGMLISVALLSACDRRPEEVASQSPVNGQQGQGEMPAADRPASPDTAGILNYVAAAAAGDLFEIQSSELALKHSQNPEVRAFAEKMIADHRATSRNLNVALAETGAMAPVSPALNSPQREMLDGLRKSATTRPSEDFDSLYLDQQRTAHRDALNLHMGMAENELMPPALREFAGATATKVQEHHDMLMKMGASVPAEGAASKQTTAPKGSPPNG